MIQMVPSCFGVDDGLCLSPRFWLVPWISTLRLTSRLPCGRPLSVRLASISDVNCGSKSFLVFSAKDLVGPIRRSSTRQMLKQLADVPTASGGLSRLAANRVRKTGTKLEPLLSRVGLTIGQIDDPEQRIDARNQIAFLAIVCRSAERPIPWF